MAQLDLREVEREVQGYWVEYGVYREVVECRRGGKKFYFCQGPPFTSGKAHIGHAWNTAIKDWVIRYKTMCGYDVFRRAGWDMHGLPIEVKVEETVLKSRSKKDIEEFGIENFIAECRKFAIANMNNMTEQLKRLGAWLDWDNPYMTLDRGYMESVWFGIKRAHEKNLLYEDSKVIHWCPRCETAVAGYEVGDEYREVSDPSIYVKAKLRDKKDEYILIWTTTPWTLPANTGIAVNPEFTYVKVEYGGEKIILVKDRLNAVFKEGGYRILEEFPGARLDGLVYDPILDIPVQRDVGRRVVLAADVVTLEDGSGCVHIAPGHGEEDYRVGKTYGLKTLSPVDEAGRLTVEPYVGVYIRDANPLIIEQLKKSGALFREERIVHRYPHCWRCKTPLLLRTTKQWFLAVSKIRDDLLEKNKEIEWIPEWIGCGRFENWLRNAEDWCISRQRYWNTPLPVWVCGCGHIEVVGSLKELIDKAVEEINSEELDLHRPYIDRVKLRCSRCGKSMSRVKDVLDVWIDSGSASWANLGYPHSLQQYEKLYPADFITEGSDQTRGWFYSMLVMSTIALDRISYKRVLYHGFTLDAEGRKMSKSLGNVVDPMEVIDKHGADVFRFYVLSATVPWDDLCFSWDGVAATERSLNILWNVYAFADTYMKLDNYDPKKVYKLELQLEDRWLLSKYNSLVEKVTSAAEKCYPHEFTREINEFILEMSRWYVKLIRDRVWIEGDDPRKMAAYHTLYSVLTGLLKLMATVTPHLSEHLYRKLTGERSVHLSDWPTADSKLINKELEESMAMVQEIVECVNSARQTANIKLRWPISRVVVALKEKQDLSAYEHIILKMSNAKTLELKDVEQNYLVKPNLATVGPKYKKDVGRIISHLKDADGRKIKEEVDETGFYRVGEITLSKEDLLFEARIPDDLVAQSFSRGIVYIDSKINSTLLSESMAREVVRRIQEMRKQMKLKELEVVSVNIECDKEFEKYIVDHKTSIEKETRSRINIGAAQKKGFEKVWDIEGSKLLITIVRE